MINISLILWGFDTKKKQFTAISLPFEDSKEELYYSQLAKEILAYLKILIGYTYDMYELTKNSSMPLLPYANELPRRKQRGIKKLLLSLHIIEQ